MQADWKSDRWYIALVIVSGLAVVAAIAAPMDDQTKRGVVFACAGGFLFGLGEWHQHQLQTRVSLDGRLKITSYPRRFRTVGSLLNLAGLVCATRGLWLLW